MFQRILIANRGEIACRVIRTARRLGIETVAVFSDADREAMHVELADHAVFIGPAPASESYLRQDKILAAALSTQADAIHPGYGFLSENADFSRACDEAGICFIGPPAAAIEAMGSKSHAKKLMGEADVPLIPGYHGDDQADDRLRKEAVSMGFPILLKATAGGGGKGMRAVEQIEDFADALAAARRESQASFGDDRMLIEKLIQRPRHVEVQIFCDAHGNGVFLAERDCSIQRRHQKVIEEAPAPNLAASLRVQMGEVAVAAARAIDYRGAGTVEFLLDADQKFYFMEMNTRLQVEHPVTEMVTGQDLVEWQLRVAAGEPLPQAQEEIQVHGHAMEARIYAEDPRQGFLPSTGKIHYLRTPAVNPSVRIDSGICAGSEISPFYDPMIAKLVCFGEDREAARKTLLNALLDYQIAGPQNNVEFLAAIAHHAEFASANLDTGFIERHQETLIPPAAPLPEDRDLAAASLILRAKRQRSAATQDARSPWAEADGWRMNGPARQAFEIEYAGAAHCFDLETTTSQFTVHAGDRTVHFAGALDADTLTLEIDGHRLRATYAIAGEQVWLFWPDGRCKLREKREETQSGAAAAGDAGFAAPMHGTVIALLVAPGAKVAAGDPVIVIEAMKMEQTLRAPVDGQVTGFNAACGDMVDRGVSLVDFVAVDSP